MGFNFGQNKGDLKSVEANQVYFILYPGSMQRRRLCIIQPTKVYCEQKIIGGKWIRIRKRSFKKWKK
jgi:hypothetical protein